MVQLNFQAGNPNYVVGAGLKPCIWGHDAASVPVGIETEEQRWRGVVLPDMQSNGFPPGVQPPPERRLSVAERLQARALQLRPVPLDAVDTVRSVPGPHMQWRVAWAQLRRSALGNEQWAFAWRLLHGRLYVGAFLAHINARFPHDSALCCQSDCADADRLETLSHLFLTCTAVQPVLLWMQRLWHCIAGQDVPLTAAVVVAGDGRAWEPGGGQAGVRLWHALRLTVLHTIWCHRCQARIQGRAHHALGIISGVVHRLCASIRMDWRRTQLTPQETGRLVTAVDDGLRLTPAQFKERWALGGVLCTIDGGEGAHTMRVLLSISRPVPLRDVMS